MRLGLYFYGHPKDSDSAWYHVGIRERDGNIRNPTNSESEKLQFHRQKIDEIAIDVLGNNFSHSYFEQETGEIELCFTKGISAGSEKFDFKVFCGWVELSLM